MGRNRQPPADYVSPETQAMFDRVQAIKDRAKSLPSVSPDEIATRLAAAGLPAEKVERLKAAMKGKGAHYKRQERAEAHRAEIERMNREGLRDGEIARALGLSRPYVCQVRTAHGIPAVACKT